MTLLGQRLEILMYVLRIPNKEEITQSSFSDDIGRSSVLEVQKKWYGKNAYKPEEKRDQQADQIFAQFQKKWSSPISEV